MLRLGNEGYIVELKDFSYFGFRFQIQFLLYSELKYSLGVVLFLK